MGFNSGFKGLIFVSARVWRYADFSWTAEPWR